MSINLMLKSTFWLSHYRPSGQILALFLPAVLIWSSEKSHSHHYGDCRSFLFWTKSGSNRPTRDYDWNISLMVTGLNTWCYNLSTITFYHLGHDLWYMYVVPDNILTSTRDSNLVCTPPPLPPPPLSATWNLQSSFILFKILLLRLNPSPPSPQWPSLVWV